MRELSEKNGIISLAAVLGVGLFSLGTALMIAFVALAEFKENQDAILGDQSFYTADSGVMEGTYQYIHATSSYSGSPFLLLNNSSDSEITVTSLIWPYVEVRGSAENLRTSRTVVNTISVFPEGFAFDYAVYSQNNLNFGGNIIVNGNVFANNGINFSGASAEINGDAFSPTEITDTDNINGESISFVNPIPAPQINLDPYFEAASLGGTFFDTSAEAETYLNGETKEAIMFVDDLGKTKIQGTNTNLTGSLVTRGSLDITGGTYTAEDNYLAIIVEGDLKIAGGAVINGIVYVSGSTSFGGGNNIINGSLISAGGASVDINGSAIINYDPILAESWQNLIGLNLTSTTTPIIINWREE